MTADLSRPLLIEPRVRHYDWGSDDAIAKLQGRAYPSAEPEAELWMGAHDLAPSFALIGDRRVKLNQLIREEADTMLGPSGSGEDAPRLGFLLKVLAAKKPLSLQVHPDAETARLGFDRENRLGVPLDADHRLYRDDQPKPEILCALGPFSALHGFRPVSAIVRDLERLAAPELRELAQTETNGASHRFYSKLLRHLLSLEQNDVCNLVSSVTSNLRDLDTEQAKWIGKLASTFPKDIGALSPLILNIVTLEPGEAIAAGPGLLHSYLDGTGVELMVNSDNTIRAGLTSKHVDPGELMRITRFEETTSSLLAHQVADGTKSFSMPSTEQGSRLELSSITPAALPLEAEGGSPQILFGAGESFVMSSNDVRVSVPAHLAAFVPAAVTSLAIESTGTVFRAREVPASSAAVT